jgi:peptide/nickel transport system substrate-binding protein
MDEQVLRDLIAGVKDTKLSRRAFVRAMTAMGLTAPMAIQLLTYGGVAMAQTSFQYKPTRRGGGGALKLLWWQGPTLLNPHFAIGTKDQEGSRIFYEPLASWDPDGNLVPVLAAEIPGPENGLSSDGRSVIWKLKSGVQWHDGEPFTADDVVFNWKYATDPATAAVTIASYRNVEVQKVDDLTVRVVFAKPSPFWADAFVAATGMLIPKHLFADFAGAKSRDAPTNLKPVGTGPYRFVDFRPGDSVKGEINPTYHMENRPFFDTIEMKGGGDAVSAARAVIQTGEYDYAWNIQVEDEILMRLEKNGSGYAMIAASGNVEHLQLNFTDPWTEVEGERANIKTTHPLLSDPAVRQALSLLVDRGSVQEHIYGRTGIATGNFINNPRRFVSNNTRWEFNIDKANAILEQAGWKRRLDGIRTKADKVLKLVFQTSINTPRQKTQAIVKQACQKAGIELELKSVTPSVFFSSDIANPDTFSKFYCDIQMYTITMPQPDPEYFMNQFVSWEVATKANKWQGRNTTRWRSAEYDEKMHGASSELDPIKRAALFIQMNDLVCADQAVIPIVSRPKTTAISHTLRASVSGWDNDLADIHNWYRES